MTGLFTPVFLNACAKAPGSAATYVLLCPLISASSLTPPSEIL